PYRICARPRRTSSPLLPNLIFGTDNGLVESAAANSPLYVVRAFRTVGLAVSESIWLMWFDGSGCDCLLMSGLPERAARPRVDGGPQREIRHSLDRRNAAIEALGR